MDPVRFIHTADLHFGNTGARARLPQELRGMITLNRIEVFRRMMQRARAEGLQAVLIAGDLFDTPTPDPQIRRHVAELCEEADPVNVVITPGNHDPYVPGGVYDLQRWPSNVAVFTKPTLECYQCDDSNLVVCGWAWQSRDADAWPILSQGAEHFSEQDYTVLMGHGSELSAQPEDWKRYAPFDVNTLPMDQVRYLALGHLHWHQQVAAPWFHPAVYPGSPQALGYDESGPHSYALVTITERETHVEQVDTGGLQFARCVLHGPDFPGLQDLHDAILVQGGQKAAQTALHCTIVGGLGSAARGRVREAHRALRDRFAYLTIHDLSFEAIDVATHGEPNVKLSNFLQHIDRMIRLERDEGRRKMLQQAREHGLAAAALSPGTSRGTVYE